MPTPTAESAVARAISLLRQAVAMSRPQPQPPRPIRNDLPELPWHACRAVTLLWVCDSSPGQMRTRCLIDQAEPLVSRCVILSRLPVVRTIVEDIVRLIRGTRQ